MAKNRTMTRRRTFLLNFGAAVGAGAFVLANSSRRLNNQAQAIANEQRFAVIGAAPLRDRAVAKGLIYGAAANYNPLFQDSEELLQKCFVV